ncbi:uncharacterized protein METZ01_LOCUS464003, partial [marine metagenome]
MQPAMTCLNMVCTIREVNPDEDTW